MSLARRKVELMKTLLKFKFVISATIHLAELEINECNVSPPLNESL